MTLSWISRRNGDSFEPPWVDLIFPRPCLRAAHPQDQPDAVEIVVTVHDPTRELGKAGTAGAISSRVSGG
jgi:hypothetical protein